MKLAFITPLTEKLTNWFHVVQLQESVSVPDTAAQVANLSLTINNLWVLLCAALVFIMTLGFACVEAGFAQSKNTVNVLFKNTLDFAVGVITYVYFGFNLMYPGEFNFVSGWLGFSGWGLSAPMKNGALDLGYNANYTYWTDFIFQAMFAATCATIVSGAVAERIRISAYFIFTFFLVGFIYPILGSWKWGGGWLNEYGFYDFAGSTVVHSVGGWAALACIIILGPRIGKYENGKVNDFPGVSIPLATIGVFLLWFGWFGFNGGSVLSADPSAISLVMVTTGLAGVAGSIGGVVAAYFVFKRLDLGMALNGILAGLVGITAGADKMSPNEAVLIGLVCGVVVVFSVIALDKLKLDDCVGAVSVHLTCGILGTLFVGVFGDLASGEQFIKQLVGVAAYCAVAFPASLLIFFLIKLVRGVRVSEEHEKAGMDSHEHGIRGYSITYDE